MFLFCGKQATGSLSFAPGMDYGDLNEGIESAEIDAEEAGDSDEPGADGSDKEHDHNAKLPDSQSCSPLRSAQISEKNEKLMVAALRLSVRIVRRQL